MNQNCILLSDNPAITSVLQKSVFRRRSCRFLMAGDGGQAWELIEKGCPDIIFLDLDLPGMDEALCRRIRSDARFRSIPILAVVTGGREDAERFRRAGCDEVLIGPLKRHRLTWLTRRLLRFPTRQEKRLEARLRIRYGSAPPDVHTACTLNLGTGGALVLAPRPLPINTAIFLEILLPGFGLPIRCRGRVAWLGAPAGTETGPREMGVEFLGLPSDAKNAIRDYIEGEGVRLPA